MNVAAIVRLARPSHWIKNLIVLFPVVFAMRAGSGQSWALAAGATLAFCFVSSAVYILNDLRDRDSDRRHPRKRTRPLACGEVGVPVAIAVAGGFALAAVAVAAAVNAAVLALVLAYLVLQQAYTFFLKERMLLDVICIALGFVLRAAAGAAAIRVVASPWLVICTFTACLFMGFCKRRNEIATIDDARSAGEHRPTLVGYTPELLTHLITLSAAVAIVSYLLYACSARTVRQFETTSLVYSLPVVVYLVTRFAMLSISGRYAGPTDIVLRDWPFQLAALIWAGGTWALIYWGKALEAWLGLHCWAPPGCCQWGLA